MIVELRRRLTDPYLDIGSRLKIDALVSSCQVIGKMLSVGLHASVIEFSRVMLELRQSLHRRFGFLQAGLKIGPFLLLPRQCLKVWRYSGASSASRVRNKFEILHAQRETLRSLVYFRHFPYEFRGIGILFFFGCREVRVVGG